MVGSVTQSGQQQFAAVLNKDVAKAGFGQAVQNQPVLVAGKVTKAKAAEYQFPYKVGEKIGDFADAKYGVFFDDISSYNGTLRLDERFSQQDVKPSIKISVIINQHREDIDCVAHPTKKDISNAIIKAIQNNQFKNSISLALPDGYRSDGKGKHIKQNVLEMNIGNNNTPSWQRFPIKGSVNKGAYNIGKIFTDYDIYHKLSNEVAARDGNPFKTINIKDVKYSDLEKYSANSYAILDVCSRLVNFGIVQKGGIINIFTSTDEKNKVIVGDSGFQSISDLAKLNKVAINLTEDNRPYSDYQYSFKTDGTVWRNGKPIVKSFYLRDKDR
jgi:hypothetical protein